MYRVGLVVALVLALAAGAMGQPELVFREGPAGGPPAADDPTGGALTDAQVIDECLAGVSRAWAGYGRDMHGLSASRLVSCRLADEAHALRMSTAALRYRLRVAIALAVFSRRDDGFDQARGQLSQSVNNATNEFSQEISQAWYQDWNAVSTDLQPLYEQGSRSSQTFTQHMNQIANDGSKGFSDPSLSGVRPIVRMMIPELPLATDAMAALEDRADAALDKAFATYAEAVATEEEASLSVASGLLENYVGDETLLREGIDEVLRGYELRSKDALETLRSECRRALLALALEEPAAPAHEGDAP